MYFFPKCSADMKKDRMKEDIFPQEEKKYPLRVNFNFSATKKRSNVQFSIRIRATYGPQRSPSSHMSSSDRRTRGTGMRKRFICMRHAKSIALWEPAKTVITAKIVTGQSIVPGCLSSPWSSEENGLLLHRSRLRHEFEERSVRWSVVNGSRR
jgi:hypothetical protein